MKLARLGLALAGMTLALVGATPLASASEPTGGATPMIIGGQNATSGPWAARMFVGGRQTCSATIIAPTWILTARHCADAGTGYSFRVGSLDQTTGGTMVNGTQATRHPSADIALIKLANSVQATYSPLGTTADVRTGQTVQVYGWGATSRCGSEINCQSRYLKVANVSVTSVNSRDAYSGIAVQARRGDGITAGGDSGGPMFASGRQVGVASTSDRQTVTNYTNITRYRDWIQQVAGV
ncbi:S1 family peptidase [Amycolatopsis anabasis]|uniref:S1 family peptidase n=1 Tax=Amycolatopsis anabasis TaxID=1840409 RepID=UPI00131D7A5A|nr:trypsin-like serine protease [Amycolatopsis anabasis]